MSELKPDVSTESASMTVVGTSNYTTNDANTSAFAYGSMSVTVGAVTEPADYEPNGAPSEPLNADGVRVLDSVVRAGGREAKFLRDTSGEF